MKTRRIIALLLAVLMAVFIAGCAQSTPAPSSSPSAASESPSAEPSATPSASPADTSVTVNDMAGRTVKLDKPAEKIVVITASDAEILYALGAGATVVGRGEYCDYPAEITSVTSVKSGADMNIEQIVALKPDVVLMSQMDQTQEQVASLENAGLKVVMSNAQDIAGVYTAIAMVGQVVGKNDEAAKIVDSMKKTFDDLKTKAQQNGTAGAKSIYFEVSPLQYGLYAAGSGTFMDEIATMLGLKNAFADMQGWPQVSEEQVIQRNPDYIVTTTMSYEGSPDPIKEIEGRKGWDKITAIKSGAVYNADSNAITRPGPRLADAAQELYDFVYGAGTTAAPSPSK